MRISIIDLLGSPYDGDTLSKRGLGGSESAVISISRELVKLGLTVDVYNDCTHMECSPGVYDGVSYYDRVEQAFNPDLYDVVISSRSTHPFRIHKIRGKKILWMHDTFVDGDHDLESMVVNDFIDEIWTLSDFHTSYVTNCNHGHRRMMEVLKRKIWQTRNGCNIYHDYIHYEDKCHSMFVWNASVTKGLRTCLEDVWPKIIEKIPAAELCVIGGYYNLNQTDEQKKDWQILRSEHQYRNNVYFTGVLPQNNVAEYLYSASFMLYPQSLPETYGISVLEAQAYGVPVITGRFGALEEVAIEDACYLMDYPIDSNPLYTFDKDAHIDAFVKMVVDAYNDKYLWQQKANKSLIVRDVCGWDKIALQWKQHLYKITNRYLPVDEYRSVSKINQRCKEIFNTRWYNPEDQLVSEPEDTHFVVIVPFRNAENYIEKCLESIFSQDYYNYDVYVINDSSDDKSHDIIMEKYKDDVWYTKNTKSIGALANQLNIIKSNSVIYPQSVIVLIDGDDSLVNDPNIFKKLNRLYRDGADMTYGSCYSLADRISLIAQEYSPETKKSKKYTDQKFAWNVPYTHLRTFRSRLYDLLDDSSLRDSNGDYYRAGGDTALFYAILDVVDSDKIICVRDVWYLYNDLNPNNDYKVNSEEQTKNANEIIMKENKKKSDRVKTILIAIPTAQSIHPETFKSIYDLEIPDGYLVKFQYFYGYCIDQVRNLIADWVVNTPYDYLFSVDYDISFPSDTLKKLLDHDVDVVSGLYMQRKPQETILELYKKSDSGDYHNIPLESLKKNDLVSIDACGFGCVLVKRDVLKMIEYPQFTYHQSLRIEDTCSEDISFCRLATAKGFKIYADTSVICDHHGMTTFTLPPFRSFDPSDE